MKLAEPTRILVATDFSECSQAAVAYAIVLARRFGASIHLLYVAEPPTLIAAEAMLIANQAVDAEAASARARLEALSAELGRAEVADVSREVAIAFPADAIVERANSGRWDLVVVGTHGRSGLAHVFLGSVAERVVRRSRIPVVSVRGEKLSGAPGVEVAR